MKKLLQMKFMLLLCALIVGSGTMWAEEKTSTLTFTAACGGSGIANDEVTWIVTSDGTESSFDSTKGIHYGTNSAKVTYIQLSTNEISGTVTKVKVNASTASNVTATVGVTIGGKDFGGDPKSLTTTATDYTFTGSSSGEIIVTVTKPEEATKAIYVKSVEVTYSTASLTDSDFALTDAPIALSFDLYNNSTAQVINYTSTSVGDVTVEENEYVDAVVDPAEKTISVTPKKVTPATNAVEITVNQESANGFKAGSATFTVTITDSTPGFTVTLGDDNTALTEATIGAGVTLPERATTVTGYTFAGWSETNVSIETTTAPNIIPAGTYYPTVDITLYPVYRKLEGGGKPSAFSVGDTGNYAIVSAEQSGKYYALPTNPTVNSGKITAQEITVSEVDDVKYVTPQNATGFTWTIEAATNGYTLSDGSNYIYHSNGGASGTNLSYGSSTSFTWAFTADGDYITMAGMSSSTTNSRGLLFSGTTIGGYALSNANTSGYHKVMILPISAGSTIYYWSSPVAAAVEKPVITIAENPFLFSTTATITCATEGATIKYSYDGETWNDYTEALTITETKTIYAKAIKGNDESSVAQVTATKNLAEPTVTISDLFITHTNVYEGTAAGHLTASVKYNNEPVEGATVTWSGDNDAVAKINATTGVVDLVASGTVTFTATYAGNEDYKAKTATYEMTVTYSDPNAPGTENNPYTVAQALENTPSSGTSANVYIKGIVSKFYGNNTSVVDDNYHRYYISDEGVDNELIVFNGKGLNNTAFSSADDLQIGDKVVICGGLTMYNNASEVAANNYIVSLVRKPAAPTFSPAAGTYTSVQTVTISAADGATIYYTTNGTDPTTESTQYSEPIAVNETTTIKAIAVKDSEVSDVATAEYVIDLTPSIVFDGDQNPYDVPCTAGNTNIHYVASNITGTVSLVICDANGGETTYDWFRAAISSDVYVHVEWDANDTETRTAYFKLTDGTTTSEIFALTQAKYVPDYATLPFTFNGGRADIEETNGLTQDGLDSDYGSSPYLKFNSTNDYVILKINEVPGTLTFDIKGNTFSGGTFTVQTSADGENYTDLQTYTELGSTQSEEFDIAANVRYIKWIYTNKVSGNVALGNITLGNTSMAVTIAAACTDGKGKYYGTFSASSAFEVPENLTVSEIGIDDEGKMNVQNYESGAVVPANTGVMVSATSYGNFKLDKSSEAGTSVLGDNNALRPTGDDGVSAADMEGNDSNCKFYRLTMHNGTKLGFWYGAAEGAAFAVVANKAYMAVPASVAGARNGFVFGDDATGINNVNINLNDNDNCYDLQGRKVNKPGKGLYIVNGKKVVIK